MFEIKLFIWSNSYYIDAIRVRTLQYLSLTSKAKRGINHVDTAEAPNQCTSFGKPSQLKMPWSNRARISVSLDLPLTPSTMSRPRSKTRKAKGNGRCVSYRGDLLRRLGGWRASRFFFNDLLPTPENSLLWSIAASSSAKVRVWLIKETLFYIHNII